VRPEAHIYGIVLLAKNRTIRCEARIVAARFRSRRDVASLIRGSLIAMLSGNRPKVDLQYRRDWAEIEIIISPLILIN